MTTVPTQTMDALASAVRYAVSKDDTRHNLTRLHFEREETPEGARLVAVATDGHRLACAWAPLANGFDPGPDADYPNWRMVIPRAESASAWSPALPPFLVTEAATALKWIARQPCGRRCGPLATLEVQPSAWVLGSKSSIFGKAQEGALTLEVTFPVEADEHSSLVAEATYNARYLADAFAQAAAAGGIVRAYQKDALAPLVLRWEDGQAVVMPMRA